MDWYIYILVILVGIIAGFINTVAGGGSILTLPLLMFMGLPAVIANGTNRIGILFQSIVSTGSFKNQNVLDLKSSFWLGIPAIIGSLIGAMIAVDLNENVMEKTIGALLIFMFFIILLKPSEWIKNREGVALPYWLQTIIFFFIGIYGGFIQAGVGFFLLAGLVLGSGFDLVKANAIKALVLLMFTIFALAVFMINDQVNYFVGIILALGNMIGAYFGAKYTVKWGVKFVRYVLLITILISSIKLLGVF